MFFNIHVVLFYCAVMCQHWAEISDKNNVQRAGFKCKKISKRYKINSFQRNVLIDVKK